MYNNIGLKTPRGSGTNGYVTRNLSFVKPQIVRHKAQFGGPGGFDTGRTEKRKPNPQILEHEKKRKVEVKLLELRLAMEDRGYSEDEIEAKIETVRKDLMARVSSEMASLTGYK